MKKKLLILSFIILVLADIFAQSPTNLANKWAFKSNFPITSNFRGNNGTVATFQDFLTDMTKAKNHIPDLVDVNFFYDTTNVKFANKMAQNYPDKLFLQVMQGVSGLTKTYKPWPNDLDRISALPIKFPGHWVVKPFTNITANLSASSNVIKVANVTNFTLRNYPAPYQNGCPAMLIEIDANGTKNWNHYEYVYVTNILEIGRAHV